MCISKRLFLLVFAVLILIVLKEEASCGPTDKLSTQECTVSEVLQRISKDNGVIITMKKALRNKVPCDYRYNGDVEEAIRGLLRQEENYAMVWNVTEKGIRSAEIRFFESSKYRESVKQQDHYQSSVANNSERRSAGKTDALSNHISANNVGGGAAALRNVSTNRTGLTDVSVYAVEKSPLPLEMRNLEAPPKPTLPQSSARMLRIESPPMPSGLR